MTCIETVFRTSASCRYVYDYTLVFRGTASMVEGLGLEVSGLRFRVAGDPNTLNLNTSITKPYGVLRALTCKTLVVKITRDCNIRLYGPAGRLPKSAPPSSPA